MFTEMDEKRRKLSALVTGYLCALDDVDARMSRALLHAGGISEKIAHIPKEDVNSRSLMMVATLVGEAMSICLEMLELKHEFAIHSGQVSSEMANLAADWRATASEQHMISDPKVRLHVFNMTGGRCAYCDVTLVNGGGEAEQFCVEHVVPVSKGGPNNIVNYVPSCRACNNSKKDGHVLTFIRRNLPRRQEATPTAEVIPMQHRSW